MLFMKHLFGLLQELDRFLPADLIGGHDAPGFGFGHSEIILMGLLSYGLKRGIGAGEILLANISDGGLQRPGGCLRFGRSMLKSKRVFSARAGLVALEGVRIGNAELREDKVGIDLERIAVVHQRVIKTAG